MSLNLYSQGGFRTKIYTLNALDHRTKDVFEISPGYYLGAGITGDTSNSIIYGTLKLVGLNALGKVQWTKSYGNAKLQFTNNLFTFRTFHKVGNYLFYTGTLRDSANKQLGTLIKFDFNGNKIWQQFYSDSLLDVIPQQACASVDGGHLITGLIQGNNASPCLLIKTDANGNELWRRKLNKVTPNVSDGKAILQDSASKKIVIGGYQYLANSNTVNDNILVLDSLGGLIERVNNNPGQCHDLIQTRDKRIVIVGSISVPNSGQTDFTSYAIKFDINNPSVPIWRLNTYGPVTYINSFNTIVELPDGNLIIGGSIDSTTLVDKRVNSLCRFLWVSSAGNIIKNTYYDYTTNVTLDNAPWMTSLNLTSDGGWIVSFGLENNGNNPLFYVKYDSNGCDSTVAYCNALWAGVHEGNFQKPQVKIYPNPANSDLTIDLTENAEHDGPCSVRITNVVGVCVKEERIVLKEGAIKLNLKDLTDGVYLISLCNIKGQSIYQSKIIKE